MYGDFESKLPVSLLVVGLEYRLVQRPLRMTSLTQRCVHTFTTGPYIFVLKVKKGGPGPLTDQAETYARPQPFFFPSERDTHARTHTHTEIEHIHIHTQHSRAHTHHSLTHSVTLES